MEYVTLIGSVIAVHLLAVMSPGPDFIMCIRNSLMYSRRTGLWTAVGFGLGIGVHVLYSVVGLAFVISQSIFLFQTIKLLGAGYLVYIGIRSMLSKKSVVPTVDVEQKQDISAWSAVRIGFLTNVLNPKATLFFLSLFTFMIAPETPRAVIVIAGIMMIVNTMVWFSIVAIVMTQPRVREIFHRFENLFNKTFGGLLIVLGIKVALSKR